ncbi:unnamed protein product, partial [marine sediment metagenome]
HIWCVIIGFLLFIFWGMAFQHADKGNYIVSWVSIFLAGAVILYTWLASNRQEQIFNKSQDVLSQILTTTTEVRGKTERIESQLTDMQLMGSPETKETVSDASQVMKEQTLDLSQCPHFGLIVLHCLAESFENKKPFIVWDVGDRIAASFDRIKDYTSLHVGYTLGVISILKSLWGQNNITLSGKTLRDMEIDAKSLPREIIEQIKTHIKKRIEGPDLVQAIKDSLIDSIEQIDKYFAELKKSA